MSYSSRVPCTAVVRVEARSMIFTTCGTFTVYATSNCVASALRNYSYTASHNYTDDRLHHIIIIVNIIDLASTLQQLYKALY